MYTVKIPFAYSPPFTTETNEKPPYIDCTFAGGLMLCNKAGLGKYPNTRLERELLRIASGDTVGGASLQDLAKGIKNRYHWTLRTVKLSLPSIELRLRRGDGTASQGLYSTFKGTKYARHDVNFSNKGALSGHLMYVQGHDRKGYQHLNSKTNKLAEVFIMDPLGRGSYNGEWMPWSLYVDFLESLGGYFVATKEQGAVA